MEGYLEIIASLLPCRLTALRVISEIGPTRNKPRAVAVVLPSKQPELSVATTTNEAFAPETGEPEVAGVVTLATNCSSTGSGAAAPYENNFTGEYASLMILLGWFRRSKVFLSRTFTLAPESMRTRMSVPRTVMMTVACCSLFFGLFNVNTYSSSELSVTSRCSIWRIRAGSLSRLELLQTRLKCPSFPQPLHGLLLAGHEGSFARCPRRPQQ